MFVIIEVHRVNFFDDVFQLKEALLMKLKNVTCKTIHWKYYIWQIGHKYLPKYCSICSSLTGNGGPGADKNFVIIRSRDTS